MSFADIAGVIVGGLGASGVVYTAYASLSAAKRTQEIDKLKFVAESYTQAQGFSIEIVEQLRKEVTRLLALLDTEQNTSAELRRTVSIMSSNIDSLLQLMRQGGIVIPEDIDFHKERWGE